MFWTEGWDHFQTCAASVRRAAMMKVTVPPEQLYEKGVDNTIGEEPRVSMLRTNFFIHPHAAARVWHICQC